jgi:hypothetical protein
MNFESCTHVPRDWWNTCRLPNSDERWVHCPCCGGNGVASETDDLTDPPMVCPHCGVAAVEGCAQPESADA